MTLKRVNRFAFPGTIYYAGTSDDDHRRADADATVTSCPINSRTNDSNKEQAVSRHPSPVSRCRLIKSRLDTSYVNN